MKSIKWYYLAFLTLFSFTVISCSKDSTDSLDESKRRGDIVELKEGGRVTRENVVSFQEEYNASASDAVAVGIGQYGVTYYVITYRSIYKEKAIDTRGLLMIPDGVSNPELLTYFHGTQLPIKLSLFERQIPSIYDGKGKDFQEVITMGLSFASAGFAVFMPDYIGYASTIDKEHPYVYYPEMFKSNIDGIIAARKAMDNKGYPHSNRLFLTGWSQGGGACMSAHYYIENTPEYANQFTVVASSGLAGPYNYAGFIDYMLKKRDETVDVANLLTWALYSLNKFSDKMKRPTDQIFSYPVYDQFSAIGTPSKVPNKFMNNYALSKMIDGTDTKFREAMLENTFSNRDWTPQGNIYLHHGDADDVVLFFNSQDAANKYGVPAERFYKYPGGKHDSELGNYVKNTLKDFNTLK